MTSKLEQLRAMTTVVADTGDIEAVRRLKPVDCTTNPTIVLKALGTPMFADAVAEALRWGRAQGGNHDAVVSAISDRLAISVGEALAELVPGRVSTEVDADLSGAEDEVAGRDRLAVRAARRRRSAGLDALSHGMASWRWVRVAMMRASSSAVAPDRWSAAAASSAAASEG